MSKRRRSNRRRLRHILVLPVLITLANGLCGFTAIHYTTKGMTGPDQLLLHKPEITFFATGAWFIFLAMVCDALDGFVARKSGSSSNFGAQLDSLSDVISFGVAPAFLMLGVMESSLKEIVYPAVPVFGTFSGKLLWIAAACYVCCALLRLARFNVETTPDISSHMIFNGLPSPAAAGVIAAQVLLLHDLGPELQRDIAPEVVRIGSLVIIYMLPFITVGVALLMVSRMPYSHIVNQYIQGRKPFEYVVVLVLLLLLLIWKLQLTLAAGSLIYALSGPVRWLWRKYSRNKTGQPQPEIAETAEEPDIK
ncbi:MAG: phosphatidylcholine/phosphatidylserine synthase [Sedimentisphaerales bacterium]|nr:phosphatidylcholine/phosphatidylserine synthase [Sedimentisphaerales bacterium]